MANRRGKRPGARPGPQEHQHGIPPPPAREGGPATPGVPAGPWARQVMVHRIAQSWIWLKWLNRHAHSAYKLNKHGHNIQPCSTPFPILNQSVVPWKVLTVASWPAYSFLRRQVRWSGIPISLRIFYSLLWSIGKRFGIVNKIEVDVFLELFYFFYDPTDVGNLISGS